MPSALGRIARLADVEVFDTDVTSGEMAAYLDVKYAALISTATQGGNAAEAAFWADERAIVTAHLALTRTYTTCPIDGGPWPCPSLTSRLKTWRGDPAMPTVTLPAG